MNNYFKGYKDFQKYASKLKEVPLSQRIRQEQHKRQNKRGSQNFLNDIALRNKAAKQSNWKLEEKLNQANFKLADRKIPPHLREEQKDATFEPKFHYSDLQYPRNKEDEPFHVDNSLSLRMSKVYSQQWSSSDQNVLKQLNVYVESEEVEAARQEAALLKEENQDFTFKENRSICSNENRPTHLNYSLAGEQLWRKTRTQPYIREKKTQPRLEREHLEYNKKERPQQQEENPNASRRWVRFNVDVQNGRHKFADYRQVGGDSQIRTVEDLVSQFKEQMRQDGLTRDQMREQWELRSSRGFKFPGKQRVSNIYKFKDRYEVDLSLQKKQRMGRQYCFERGNKLYKITKCVDWNNGVFEVEWRDSRDPTVHRGEAHIQELEREAKDELYRFMKSELNKNWRR